MNRLDIDRLRDARAFAHHALYHATGLEADILADALQPQHAAALYALAIVGEALSKVPVDLRNEAPAIRWKPIIALRNHFIHAYWQIDLEIIADVVKNRREPLIADLDKLITFIERVDK
jgi:uncharacterized protein with HEPN domain